MKRMLVISYFFPPAGGVAVLRTVKLVKYIKKYGIEPIVLTPEFPLTHRVDVKLLGEIDDEIIRTPQFYLPKIKGLQKRSLKQKEVVNISTFKKLFSRIIWNIARQLLYPDQQLGWIYYAYKTGLKNIKNRDIEILYATTPPITNMIVLLLLSLKTKLPIFLDFRDDWVCDPFKSTRRYSNLINPFYYLLDRFLEKYLFKKASLIFTVSKPLLEKFRNRYSGIEKDKFLFIPNGYDEEDFEGIKPAERDNRFLIVYSGTFNKPRNPGVFLEGLSLLLKKNPSLKDNIEIRLVGHVDEEYKHKIKETGINKYFTLTGHLPHIKSMEHILASDLLLLINPDMDTDGDTFLPSKLSEYIKVEKPILAITPTGATSELIKHYNLGSSVEHNNILGISEALEIFINKGKSKHIKPSKQLLDDFNREKLVKRIAGEILHKI